MANPNPVQTEEFKKKAFKPDGEAPLGRKVFGLKFPIEIEEILLLMEDSERIRFMRSEIIEAVREKHIGSCQTHD
ncbi:MAG: hypothetical protein ACRC11_10370 [Xenococcaceae cyanobacterium]